MMLTSWQLEVLRGLVKEVVDGATELESWEVEI